MQVKHMPVAGEQQGDEPEYLTMNEIAAKLRVSVSFVGREVKAGRLRGTRLGRSVRVRVAAFEQYRKDREEAEANAAASGGAA